jgi:hypothetical protein
METAVSRDTVVATVATDWRAKWVPPGKLGGLAHLESVAQRESKGRRGTMVSA